MRAMRTLAVALTVVSSAAVLPVTTAAAKGTTCSTVLGRASVGGPTNSAAWRAGVERRTAVFARPPGNRLRPSRWLAPTDAPWLLVIARARAADRRCWIPVRMPWRPNDAVGWVNANKVVLVKTR